MRNKRTTQFIGITATCLALAGCNSIAQPQAPGSAVPSSTTTAMGSPSPTASATSAAATLADIPITAYEKEFLDNHPWMYRTPKSSLTEIRQICSRAQNESREEIIESTQNDSGSLVIGILTTACAERDKYRPMLKDVTPGDIAHMPSPDEPTTRAPEPTKSVLTAYEKELFDKHPWMNYDQDSEVYDIREYCKKAQGADYKTLYDLTQSVQDRNPSVLEILTTACAERDTYRTMLKDVKPPA